ncbi:PREDICTED: short-chain dehydrogenase/reductase family 16C member 6-like isoform X2 [Vollenhovia emeryi]|uniref:short-chain dehydrogenase/reductase family 16C member 6-like isoform X2 n=1 Tax=Vollenhovia emeryi TaxID=411798 RepID=UPI0005F45CB4|nr:PREDICTED: short-chain dehydrogenase/reductase family 16C member 6-like isoform X2 [Vollenhovia emeryi]
MDGHDDQTIGTKICNILLLPVEILWLAVKILYYICEDICRCIVPIKKKSVAGEIVLITGAGHGIGKELAVGYASLGATVVCWDINEETNNETMNDIKKMGIDSVYAYRCDITDREEIFRVARKVKEEVGDVTILINNAGIVYVKSLMNQSFDEIQRGIDVNVTAHYWTLKAFLPSMIEKNHGHVVALSSLAGLIGLPYATVYCPSKSAVNAMMEATSEELRMLSNGKSSVKFTTVCCYFVSTYNGRASTPKRGFVNNRRAKTKL